MCVISPDQQFRGSSRSSHLRPTRPTSPPWPWTHRSTSCAASLPQRHHITSTSSNHCSQKTSQPISYNPSTSHSPLGHAPKQDASTCYATITATETVTEVPGQANGSPGSMILWYWMTVLGNWKSRRMMRLTRIVICTLPSHWSAGNSADG
jgi:hypothetical protein